MVGDIDKNMKRICVVCGFPFPVGFAATNRIITYSKGMVENGYDVSILIFRRTETPGNEKNFKSQGVFDGIKFEYASSNIKKSKLKLIIGLKQIFDSLKLGLHIKHLNKTKPFDALIISTDVPIFVLFYSIIGRICKIKKIVLIVDEYPKPIRYGGERISVLSKWIFHLAFEKLHGLISISYNLVEYYRDLVKKEYPYLVMPIIVDTQRFNIESPVKENLICYIGNLEIKKDGIDILMKSFHEVTLRHDNYKLLLVGAGKDENTLMELAKDLNIENKVIFTGQVCREKVPMLLLKSKILCLSRPHSQRAEGGLPTKLGEYLAAGVPVVVTKVGEIPIYLKHKINAYLAEPNNIHSFKDQLLDVINDYQKAMKVGKAGRELAINKLDYKYQSKRMLNFLEKL